MKDSVEYAIRSAMFRTGHTVKDIEKNGIFTKTTFWRRTNNPGTFTLDEIWKLDKMLKFNDYEWSLIRKER